MGADADASAAALCLLLNHWPTTHAMAEARMRARAALEGSAWRVDMRDRADIAECAGTV